MDLPNPYTPGAGSIPPALVGRDEVTALFDTFFERTRQASPYKGLVLNGLRGVGKTVLLNEWRNDVERQGARTIQMEATDSGKFLPSLAQHARQTLLKMRTPGKAIADSVKHALAVVKSFSLTFSPDGPSFGIDIDPAEGHADSGDPELDLTDLFVALGEATQERDETLVIFIDEMQYLSKTELGACLAAFHRTVQRGLPVLLVGGGLPNLPSLIAQAKTYAERMFEYSQLGTLPREEAFKAVQKPAIEAGAFFEPDALEATFQATNGYPYFVQEWAHDSWDLSTLQNVTVDVVHRATEHVLKRLDRGFFQARLAGITDRDLLFLRSMAELGDGVHRSGDIAQQYGRAVTSISTSRDALIKRGIIYSPTYGETAFSVPMFDAFMRREHPSLDELRAQVFRSRARAR